MYVLSTRPHAAETSNFKLSTQIQLVYSKMRRAPRPKKYMYIYIGHFVLCIVYLPQSSQNADMRIDDSRDFLASRN